MEQHGERRGDDRRAGLYSLCEQETRHRERDCGRTGDRRDGDEQVQANALIEQRLGGRLFRRRRHAEHRRINAARMMPTEIMVNRPLAIELLVEW